MVASRLSRLGFGVLSVAALGMFMVPALPVKADNFAFGYSSGYYPRHYDRRHHHRHGPRYVYVEPPPVYYYPPPPPRVVYMPPPPPPVYYSPPPVAYPAQTLPGGPLAGSHCREYQSTAVVNGQQVPSYGTACLQVDGSWRIVR